MLKLKKLALEDLETRFQIPGAKIEFVAEGESLKEITIRVGGSVYTIRADWSLSVLVPEVPLEYVASVTGKTANAQITWGPMVFPTREAAEKWIGDGGLRVIESLEVTDVETSIEEREVRNDA